MPRRASLRSSSPSAGIGPNCDLDTSASLGRAGFELGNVTGSVSCQLGNRPNSGGAESGAESAENGSNRAERLEVIADLLADLPAAERAKVIAELAPAERAAIARLLIGKGSSEGKR